MLRSRKSTRRAGKFYIDCDDDVVYLKGKAASRPEWLNVGFYFQGADPSWSTFACTEKQFKADAPVLRPVPRLWLVLRGWL